MKTRIAALVLALAAAPPLACDEPGQDSPKPTQLSSGMQGQALLGPQCPVVRIDTPCPDRPLQATVVVWSADQTERVTFFTTDEQGRFRVPLAPGAYYLDPQPCAPRSAVCYSL